jgi:hypothetical protein
MFANLRSNLGNGFRAISNFTERHPNVSMLGAAGAVGGLGYLALRQRPTSALDEKMKAWNKRYWTDSPEWENYRFQKNVGYQRDAGLSQAAAEKMVRSNPDWYKA